MKNRQVDFFLIAVEFFKPSAKKRGDRRICEGIDTAKPYDYHKLVKKKPLFIMKGKKSCTEKNDPLSFALSV